MTVACNSPFAEIIESSIYTFTAQTWLWNEFPSFGSLMEVQTGQRAIFGIVYHIQTGSIDSSRTPFTYKKTLTELAHEQPQIFEFLQTTFICHIVGYIQEDRIYYVLAPEPAPIHTFVQTAHPSLSTRFFSSFHYLHLLFHSAGYLQNLDELLLAIIHQQQLLNSFHSDTFIPFMKTFSLLTGNDYRRIKLFLQRVESLMNKQ